ncbi:hypothetical protein D9615_005478 [Tricholomella constricta]|uniref:Uncharacterized protein n=1 Tax=Tricholomella constricta TaxID=117010 RepID=A0A8H5HE88_9AGAR|nr:hypothetical protein D9615_005478 [Tricholomella constricta]
MALSDIKEEGDIFKELNQKRNSTKDCEAELRRQEYALKAYCSRRQAEEMSSGLLNMVSEDFDDDEEDELEIPYPVFAVSTRDYLILNKRIRGEVACFLDVAGTRIPELQTHCRRLPRLARQEYAQSALEALKRTTRSMAQALETFERNDADRCSLANLWASKPTLRGKRLSLRANLRQQSKKSSDATADKLKHHFRQGLDEICASAAKLAISEAPRITDEIIKPLQWQRLRAAFRRQGAYGEVDINMSFTEPFFSTIANSWRATLDKDVFPEISEGLQKVIKDILDEGIDSCQSVSFKDITKARAALALEEANSALRNLQLRVKLHLDKEQKKISRSIRTQIQEKLEDAYREALEFTGRGSVRVQKGYFTDFVEQEKKKMFEGLIGFVIGGLDELAESAGETVQEALTLLVNRVSAAVNTIPLARLIENLRLEIHDEMSLLWKENTEQTRESIKLRESIEQLHEELEDRYQESLEWDSEEA